MSTLPPPSPTQDAPAAADGRPLRRFLRRRWEGWRLRHQLPFNFAIHAIGIPMAVSSIPLLAVGWYWGIAWYWGVGAFVLGYLLQYIGHLVEGNDLGEWAAIKRLLGWPYVGISPRWNPEDPNRL